MIYGFYEEGDNCPECMEARLEFIRTDSCSCHINPPCSSCVSAPLACPECSWEDESEPPYKDVTIVPGLAMREYKPRALSKTTIDWRAKMHTHFTQICEGVYPKGVTRKEVEAKVKGTFGGRFEKFSNGQFKYIAYTD